jgi:ubiquitin-conjugating enzyme E2 variant
MKIVFEVVVTVLLADFVSGFFHWLEDAYGREDWPITGRLVTRPNIIHHREPRYFTRHNWFQSSWDLLCLGLILLLGAWALGWLTWQVGLFVFLGVNANQVHKWAHRTAAENGVVITLLQRIGLAQTPRHHAGHHTDPKNSHYCVLTNLLNPIFDRMRVWDGLEWLIRASFGIQRRPDPTVCVPKHKASGFRQLTQGEGRGRLVPARSPQTK